MTLYVFKSEEKPKETIVYFNNTDSFKNAGQIDIKNGIFNVLGPQSHYIDTQISGCYKGYIFTKYEVPEKYVKFFESDNPTLIEIGLKYMVDEKFCYI